MFIKCMQLPPIFAWVQVNMYPSAIYPIEWMDFSWKKKSSFKNSSLVQFQRSHFTNYLPLIILSKNLGHTMIETINTFFLVLSLCLFQCHIQSRRRGTKERVEVAVEEVSDMYTHNRSISLSKALRQKESESRVFTWQLFPGLKCLRLQQGWGVCTWTCHKCQGALPAGEFKDLLYVCLEFLCKPKYDERPLWWSISASVANHQAKKKLSHLLIKHFAGPPIKERIARK